MKLDYKAPGISVLFLTGKKDLKTTVIVAGRTWQNYDFAWMPIRKKVGWQPIEPTAEPEPSWSIDFPKDGLRRKKTGWQLQRQNKLLRKGLWMTNM